MQGTTALRRLGARALVLALASILLVVLGYSGAQASPSSLAVGAVAVAPTMTKQSTQPTTALVATAGHAQTTCIPGRGKARMEADAVAPSPAQLQVSAGSAVAALPHALSGGSTSARLRGRIPSSPTHLDLGIVRT